MYLSGPMNGQKQDDVTLHFPQSMMGYHSWKDVVTLRLLTGLLILVAVLYCASLPNTFFIQRHNGFVFMTVPIIIKCSNVAK